MTVSNSNRRNAYDGNDVTTVFAYTFKIQDASQIRVTGVDANGIETPEYAFTVDGVGVNGGGNVTMTTAPATGAKLIITPKQPFQQNTDYVAGSAFTADTHESALDELTLNDNEQWEVLDRSIQAKIGDGPIGQLPTVADRASKMMAFSVAGDPVASSFTESQVAAVINSVGTSSAVTDTSTITHQAIGAGAPDWILQLILNLTVNAKVHFGAVGNDTADDSTALQNAFDYAWEQQKNLYIPAGTYKTTITLNMWVARGDTEIKGINVFGDTRHTTAIKKYGNVGVSNQLQADGEGLFRDTDVDAILFIKSAYFKDNAEAPTGTYGNQEYRGCNFVLSNIHLISAQPDGDPNKVANGIYSEIGFKNFTFQNVKITDVITGCATKYVCYLGLFSKFRISRPSTGFDLTSPVGGNTTLVFEEINIEAPHLYSFSIKGNAIIRMSNQDGGFGVFLRSLGAHVYCIKCHTEAPVSRGCLHAYGDFSGPYWGAGRITAVECNWSVGTDGFFDYAFLADVEDEGDRREGGKILCQRCNIGPMQLTFPALTTTAAELFSAPRQNVVLFDDCRINTDQWDTTPVYPDGLRPIKYIISASDLTTPRNVFWSFVLGTVSTSGPDDRSVMTVTENATTNRLDLSCSSPITGPTGGDVCLMFTDPVDVTGYSKLRMIAENNNFDTVNSVHFFLSKQLYPDGFFVADQRFPGDFNTIEIDSSAFDQTPTLTGDREYILSLEDLTGNYFIGIIMPGGYSAPYELKIRDIALVQGMWGNHL